MRLTKYIALCFLLLLPTSPVAADIDGQEKITEFISLIRVNKDSSIEVTEKITVNSTGDKIDHGICRDFPTHYKDKNGQPRSVGFHVLSVLHNNERIAYSTKDWENGQRVYMGANNIRIKPGIHTFTLTYKTTRQIGFFEEHDELYWNVTGNKWKFPIQRAATLITLPSGANILKSTGYTGQFGERGKDFNERRAEDNSMYFETTRELAPGENLTAVVAWPKGIVHTPTSIGNIIYYLSDHPVILILLAYLIGHLFLGLLTLLKQKEPVIVPQFTPPENLSPALMNYIYIGFSDHGKKAFTATLVNMAIKKYIKIAEKDGAYCLVKQTSATDALSEEEKKVAEKFFAVESEILMGDDNRSMISDALGKMRSYITLNCHEKYFETSNYTSINLMSLIINIACFLALAKHNVDTRMTIIGFSIFYGLFWGTFQRNAPSPSGNKLIQKIAGFKMYLSTTEKDRLNKLTQRQQMTTDLFEKYLPYAIALGVENSWGERLAASVHGDNYQTYIPSWYAGDSWDNHHPWKFTQSITNGLTSSVFDLGMPSRIAPSGGSSGGLDGGILSGESGFSGSGGFSGGGGGGGGGGGF